MSRPRAPLTVASSYQDHQVPVPGVMVHRPVTSGALVASSRSTSLRVLQPAWSASTRVLKDCSRS